MKERYKQFFEDIPNNIKKEFISYAKEIFDNFKKYYPNFDKLDFSDTKVKNKIMFQVMQTISTMGMDENNPNYKNLKKFFPKNFNKDLIGNGSGNMYDSMWWQLADKQKENIVKNIYN